jgi:hypothetical protein
MSKSVIGEVKATVIIKDDVIWCCECNAIAFGVQVGYFSCLWIHGLNASTDVFAGRGVHWNRVSIHDHWFKHSTVITDIEQTVWTQCGSIWSTRNFRDDLFASIGMNSTEAWSKHLNEYD